MYNKAEEERMQDLGVPYSADSWVPFTLDLDIVTGANQTMDDDGELSQEETTVRVYGDKYIINMNYEDFVSKWDSQK